MVLSKLKYGPNDGLPSFGPRTRDADASRVPLVAGVGLCGGDVVATFVGGGWSGARSRKWWLVVAF
jgi:hypothetical protein